MKNTTPVRPATHVTCAAALLLALVGCAGRNAQRDTPASTPQTRAPQPAPSQPATPQVAPAPQADATTVAPASPQPRPVVTQQPIAATPPPVVATPPPQTVRRAAPPVARTPASVAPAPKSAASPAVTSPLPVAPPTLDLTSLTERLRGTKAIGIFTKITLKNQVDDLLGHFREHYRGKPTPTMAELRRSFDLLMMKVLSLLQNDDQTLASAVVSSREAIWGLLSDPDKFAALQS
jgi:hypothetical protein